uniref:HMA domain-containing protein n=1 Tax=Oryza brachyantha TaxID=4533 RepID=J3LXF8_ORYBR
MAILVIHADLKCCRCKEKLSKILCSLRAKYGIEKTEYEDKEDRVIVRGNFPPDKLRSVILCKAGGKLVRDIAIVDVWPPPPPPPPPKKKPDEKDDKKGDKDEKKAAGGKDDKKDGGHGDSGGWCDVRRPINCPPPPCPQQPVWPPPWGGCRVACEQDENACSVM